MERFDADDAIDKATELGRAVKQKLPGKRGMTISLVCLALLFVLFAIKGKIYYDLAQNEILFIKEMGSGKVYIHKNAGWKWVRFGEPTMIKKSYTFWFSNKADQGKKNDESIKARFNDNGHGNISGSIRINSPLNDKQLLDIYSQFKTQEAIEHEIIRTTLEKAVYFAGPLMSSTESASTKRNMLLSYIEDQAQSGIYKTVSEEVKVKDTLTGADKTMTQVRLLTDEKKPNGIARHEQSLLAKFGFTSSNLSINEIVYDDEVEAQIKAQRESIMSVQTSIAAAKKAEQDTITTEEKGKATAAKAKWAQETLKATAVTKAEQDREVARIDKEAAEFTKQKLILEGQGEAEKRRLIMAADGALDKKLKTYENVMGRAVQEFAKQKWVPEIVMGGGYSGSAGAGTPLYDMMNMMSLSAMKSIGLDMGIPIGKSTKK